MKTYLNDFLFKIVWNPNSFKWFKAKAFAFLSHTKTKLNTLKFLVYLCFISLVYTNPSLANTCDEAFDISLEIAVEVDNVLTKINKNPYQKLFYLKNENIKNLHAELTLIYEKDLEPLEKVFTPNEINNIRSKNNRLALLSREQEGSVTSSANELKEIAETVNQVLLDIQRDYRLNRSLQKAQEVIGRTEIDIALRDKAEEILNNYEELNVFEREHLERVFSPLELNIVQRNSESLKELLISFQERSSYLSFTQNNSSLSGAFRSNQDQAFRSGQNRSGQAGSSRNWDQIRETWEQIKEDPSLIEADRLYPIRWEQDGKPSLENTLIFNQKVVSAFFDSGNRGYDLKLAQKIIDNILKGPIGAKGENGIKSLSQNNKKLSLYEIKMIGKTYGRYRIGGFRPSEHSEIIHFVDHMNNPDHRQVRNHWTRSLERIFNNTPENIYTSESVKLYNRLPSPPENRLRGSSSPSSAPSPPL